MTNNEETAKVTRKATFGKALLIGFLVGVMFYLAAKLVSYALG